MKIKSGLVMSMVMAVVAIGIGAGFTAKEASAKVVSYQVPPKSANMVMASQPSTKTAPGYVKCTRLWKPFGWIAPGYHAPGYHTPGYYTSGHRTPGYFYDSCRWVRR